MRLWFSNKFQILVATAAVFSWSSIAVVPTFDDIYFDGSVIKGIKVAFQTLAEEESRGSKLVNKGQVLLN